MSLTDTPTTEPDLEGVGLELDATMMQDPDGPNALFLTMSADENDGGEKVLSLNALTNGIGVKPSELAEALEVFLIAAYELAEEEGETDAE